MIEQQRRKRLVSVERVDRPVKVNSSLTNLADIVLKQEGRSISIPPAQPHSLAVKDGLG